MGCKYCVVIDFSGIAVFIGARNVDGAGIVQTPEVKMVSFIILGIMFLLVVLIQLIFLYFIKKHKSSLYENLLKEARGY